ncbi:sun protein [Halothece sp. PCC 7418]|uniref:16S rRNA (cytosine(967)-C(5))-methyltransferase n=1 Tax=Halothece sp. (strain PCC 7418) TaxID=65093 RepID=UPI0002A0677A|nr:16S rRNA (cytosine(967)-C(5))-methyltransferase [Halothece sp. PCC 7418]AFZ43595.1 sun protein [Halothece sp. PCC 7418]
MTDSNPRKVAFNALRDVVLKGAYAEVALDRAFSQATLSPQNYGLVSELVYGIVRRQRTLDALIDQFASKPASEQPPKLRLILQLGFYQLRYLTQVPPSAAVDTSVELAKSNHLGKLSRVVNGILRQYIRQREKEGDPLHLPNDPIQKLGIQHSFPDWLIQLWCDEFGEATADQLGIWFNQSPNLDLRINPLKTTPEALEKALTEANIAYSPLPFVPLGLRLSSGVGKIEQLPGFTEGWWTVQDFSAQLVSYLLSPQAGETIIDACAAPGGKTTHIAELMGDEGKIWACDRAESRLKKVTNNAQRLQLKSIETRVGDARELSQFQNTADRVLIDAPCSGLGTLHRRTDLRWRQTPENLVQLAKLQQEILTATATWVKPNGILVYATCTINPLENEDVIQAFLSHHPEWKIEAPPETFPAQSLVSSSGWLKVIPTEHNSDGFFMVRLRR